jgi:cytochrome c
MNTLVASKRRPALFVGIFLAVASFAMPQPHDESAENDEIRGKEVFQRRCGGCHSLDHAMEGPRLRGVYGRQAGSTPDFRYSDALKNARITWNDNLLDKWLTDTEGLVPDNDMSFRVPNPDERREVIAWLKSLSH